jgi:hypothetical protein
LDLIPTDNKSMEIKVTAFNNLDNAIKTNFSEILLATMDIYYKLYGDLKSTPVGISSHNDGGREQVMRNYLNKSCNIHF